MEIRKDEKGVLYWRTKWSKDEPRKTRQVSPLPRLKRLDTFILSNKIITKDDMSNLSLTRYDPVLVHASKRLKCTFKPINNNSWKIIQCSKRKTTKKTKWNQKLQSKKNNE